MLRRPSFIRPATSRRLTLWLLAAVMVAQAVGASVLATVGPVHSHKASVRSVALEYFDLRRAPSPIASRPSHVLTAFGHFHGDRQPHRHYHRADDDSVVMLDAGGSPQGDEAREATCAAALAAVALLPSPLAGFARDDAPAPRTGATWPSLTHDPEPLEKPPRFA